MKTSKKVTFTVIVILLTSMSITFIYTLDKAIMPRVVRICDAETRSRVTEILNNTINEEYSKSFNYEEMIKVDKDSEGNITMVQADTLKLARLATRTIVNAQTTLNETKSIDVKVPIGQVTNNNLLANLGPTVKVKMQPIGHITTKYLSDFETAGINQTRLKIYIEATTKVKIILPFQSYDVEIATQMPVAETIIVGKVPETAIQLDLDGK